MANVLFVIKTFLLSIVIIMLLQIKWGEKTIDEMLYSTLQTNSALTPVSEAANGGVLWVKNTYGSIVNLFSDKLKNQIERTDAPGNRKIELKRHAEKAKEKATQARSRFNSWLQSEEATDTISE